MENTTTLATTTKALPSEPIWYSLTMNFGFYDANRQRLWELMALYQKHSTIHACIDINAKAIVAAKPCLFKKVNKGAQNLTNRGLKRLSTDRYKKLTRQMNDYSLNRKSIDDEEEELVEVIEHEFLIALNDETYGQNFNSLLRLLVVNLQIYGIAFLRKVRNKGGTVVDYEYLPTYNIMPIRGAKGVVDGWWYTTTFGEVTTKTAVPQEDIIVFRWPSTSDPRAGGDSPLLSALRMVEINQKWIEYMDWLIGNRARPDWLFIPKMPDGGSLSPEQVAEAEKRVNDKFRGPGNGRVGIMEQAGSAIAMQFSPTDMAPLAYDEQLKKALLFTLGIPVAFTDNDSNRSNMEASLEQWARQSLAPIVTIFEDKLTKEAQEYDSSLVVIFENVIPEDEQFTLEEKKFELTKWQVALQYGGITNPDYRDKMLGLDPLPEAEVEAQEVEVEETPAPTESPSSAPEEKRIDILQLNETVARGEIDKATAINLLVHCNGITPIEAKKLVTSVKKRKRNNGKERNSQEQKSTLDSPKQDTEVEATNLPLCEQTAIESPVTEVVGEVNDNN